jgi:Subtilisin inhibitor-like
VRGIVAPAALLACVTTACGWAAYPLASQSAVAGRTRLTIELHPNGLGRTPVVRHTLRCQPAGGTLPHPAAACAALLRLAHPFASVPGGVACATIVLGPQVALVRGTLRGTPVATRLSRQDSCQNERWTRVARALGLPS